MARWVFLAAVIVLLVLTLGCSRGSAAGFKLPAGDPHAGRVAFAELQCASCHRVEGTDLPAPHTVPAVLLGGQVPVPPTDGELTTDVINPSAHFALGYPQDQIMVAGHSRMPDYTHRMSVRQMADIVAFLHTRYEVAPLPRPMK